MKVKKLKEILDKLPDNLDVKMLLPEVEDWVDFKMKEIHLCRLKKEVKVEVINAKNKDLNENHGLNKKTDYTLKDVKNDDWEFVGDATSFTDPEDFKEWYEEKKALLIVNKQKGKVCHNRLGTIEY